MTPTEKLLLKELVYAHQIIRNALPLMNANQLDAWGAANERDGVDGEGITRANERQAMIEAIKKEMKQ